MSTASEKATPAVEPAFSGPALEGGRRSTAPDPEAPATDHTEAKLRARIAMLEGQLAEVARCLRDAETRSAEVLTLRARVTSLEDARNELWNKIAAINATRSWRYTGPLRVGGRYLRRRLGR
jgi:hypothetical protein